MKYYSERNGKQYLELHDNHTLWRFPNIDLENLTQKEVSEVYEAFDFIYQVQVEEAIEKFEKHFKNVEVFLLGRSGRHVCVEDTPTNRRRYQHLVNYAEKLEQEVIDTVNKVINDEIEQKKTETLVMFQFNQNDFPKELVEIQNIWKDKADAYGNVGSCVLGAGFNFKYKNRKYKMYPISMWQGSISWEASVPEIKQMLIDIGCTEVYFEYGNLD